LNSNYRFEQMRQKGTILGILTCVLMLFYAPFFVQDFGAWSRGHFYVIGVGPAGPRNATLQALNAIMKMDCIIATLYIEDFFADTLMISLYLILIHGKAFGITRGRITGNWRVVS